MTAPLTPSICKAARALLDISQPELAAAAKIGLSTLVPFETQRGSASEKTVAKIRRALERLGVEFVNTHVAKGVRLKTALGKKNRVGIDPAQIRAARALLQWSQRQLADASGLHLETIIRLERPSGSRIYVDSLQQLAVTLDNAGVELVDGPGVLIASK